MAHVAADTTVALDRVRNPSPVLHAILTMLLLLTATVLAVYKPVGLTAYGRRKQLDEARRSPPTSIPQRSAAATNASPWLYMSVGVVIAVILVVVILHLTGTVGGRHEMKSDQKRGRWDLLVERNHPNDLRGPVCV